METEKGFAAGKSLPVETKGVKTMETEKDYAGKGVAGAGLGLGIAGTALALLNGGLGGLGGLGWGNNAVAATAGAAGLSALAEKDAEIARLRSEKYTDNTVKELYVYTVGQNEKLSNELCLNRQRIAVLENQVAVLSSLTTTRIPNSMLCPGVPAVEVIHPTTTAATTATTA